MSEPKQPEVRQLHGIRPCHIHDFRAPTTAPCGLYSAHESFETPHAPFADFPHALCQFRIRLQAASQQPRHAGFPTAAQAYYYPYLYSWPSWPPAQQPSRPAPQPHTHTPGMLSRETASKQLLDMGLPAFSSMPVVQQSTMQSSLTDLPNKSSKTASALPTGQPAQADPYLTRLLQPPPRRHVWSAQPRSSTWRTPQPSQSKPSAKKVVSSQHAPGPPQTPNPRAIKDALGADVYNHFRDVLLRQQEILTHQVGTAGGTQVIITPPRMLIAIDIA